jgi:glycosyltransferase domain-containing protein
MNSGDLTILIPTHERHELLKRALDYYSSWQCSVIVVDSSKVQYKDAIPANTNYLHLKQQGFSEKLLSALKTVRSNYSCFCADDDFLSPSGLINGIKFLNKELDYVSVQGHYISFKAIKKTIQKFAIYHQRLGFRVDSNSPSERVIKTFSPYMQHFYALHRTEALVESMRLASKVNTLLCAEISVALIPMLIGKHKMLPLFWMARDSGVYSQYSTASNSSNRIIKDWPHYLNSDEGQVFVDGFASFYNKHTLDTEAQGQQLIKKTFSIYDKNSNVKAAKYRVKLKKLLPQFIVVLIRRIKSSYYKNLYREIHTVRLRILRIPGYPWSDKVAKKEWLQMKNIIEKYSVDV